MTMREQGAGVMVPERMPLLGRGNHTSPADGGCLMEFTSLLAGEAWSDRPKCTHPLLGQAARTINDTVDDSARQLLLPLATGLIGADQRGPAISAALVATLADHGLRRDGGDRDCQRALRRARARQRHVPDTGRLTRCWLRVSDGRFVVHTWSVLLARVVAASAAHSSSQPVVLLGDLLAAYRGAATARQADTAPRADPAQAAPEAAARVTPERPQHALHR